MIEGVLRAKMLAAAGVAALVGTRVYPVILPQAPTFPAITLQRVAALPTHAHDDGGKARTPLRITVQVDVWALTLLDARNTAAAVKTAIDGQRWLSDGVHGVLRKISRDLYEDGVKVYRVSTDYLVLGEE